MWNHGWMKEALMLVFAGKTLFAEQSGLLAFIRFPLGLRESGQPPLFWILWDLRCWSLQ